MRHLSHLATLLSDADGNLFELMAAVGMNPQSHLRGGDWRGCDFRGLDLSGMNLSFCRLHDARFDARTIISSKTDFRGAVLGFRSTLHKATGWRHAILEDSQRADLEALVGNGGSAGDSRPYVQRIKSASNYGSALEIYEEMLDDGVTPTEHVYATLIRIADDPVESSRWLREMANRGVAVDEAVYSAAIRVSTGYAEARKAFEIARDAVVVKTTYPFNSLMAKVESSGQAMDLLAEMRAVGIPPDRVTLNTVSEANKIDFSSAYELACEISSREAITTAEIGRLIRLARTRGEELLAVRMAEELGLEVDAHLWNAKISKSQSFTHALRLFRSMQDSGVRPDRHTFYPLLGRSPSLVEALKILSIVHDCGLAFDTDMVGQLRRVLSEPQRARSLVIEQTVREDPDETIRWIIKENLDPSVSALWIRALFPGD